MMALSRHKNAICQPKGFEAAALACGLKKNKALDLALIYSEVPAIACGAFTKNSLSAYPVAVCKEHLKTHRAQAIVVNSANANCHTGKKGFWVAKETTRLAGKLLGLKETDVLVASTGIIGRQLDFAKIRNGLPLLAAGLNRKGGEETARAIMTTDTRPKEGVVKINIGNKAVAIGAIAKGAGMIAPDMATMLCFIATDAAIEYSALASALKAAVDSSFNMISIDGCPSTNDSVIILANGLAGNKTIEIGNSSFSKFKAALKEICLDLAKMIVADAEGATKFITIKVISAKNDVEAKTAALAIANSNLFKTAVYGENRNLGRIAAAVGACGVEVKENLRIRCSDLKKNNITIDVDLKVGCGKATVYTSDLTPEYVRINAGYN
jgi:glutamate N-acetyltransferase/amino-acid N-acetyltransferase